MGELREGFGEGIGGGGGGGRAAGNSAVLLLPVLPAAGAATSAAAIVDLLAGGGSGGGDNGFEALGSIAVEDGVVSRLVAGMDVKGGTDATGVKGEVVVVERAFDPLAAVAVTALLLLPLPVNLLWRRLGKRGGGDLKGAEEEGEEGEEEWVE